MKKGIAVSNVLSWINLVIGSIFTLSTLLGIGLFPIPIPFMLLMALLMSSIILHSYAAIQLRKSLLNPSVPLNKQTPTGIRMMGYMTMLVGFILFSDSVYIFQHVKNVVKQMKMPPQVTEADFTKIIYLIGVFFLLISFSFVLNVIMNFRFLRWYLISSQKEN